MEERHADDGGDFRDSVGPAGVPRRCEQSQQKSGNLASCLLAGGVLFRPLAIRYDVSPGHRGCDTPGSQKAPSAKRCIKTRTRICSTCQRKLVRKHRAPKGALRHLLLTLEGASRLRQKAPSAKRCIKTDNEDNFAPRTDDTSESTERQKVH